LITEGLARHESTFQIKPIDVKTEKKVNNPLKGEGELWEKDKESITNTRNAVSR